MNITADMVKQLRERTGAGMMDCKKALAEKEGDMDKAIEYLREKGLSAAAKKAGRIAAEGIVDSYIHGDGRIGVLIEVNIETDFAAMNSEFKAFVRDIAMQVAAAKPEYVSREEIPSDVVEKEKQILKAQALNEGKPEKIIDRIIEGRLDKFYMDKCLLDQPWIKDSDKTIKQLVSEKIALIGENINIRRFVRYEKGEGLARRNDNLAEEVAKAIG